MKLEEVLQEFRLEDLLEAARRMRMHVGWETPMVQFEISSKDSIIDYLVTRVNNLADAEAPTALSRINLTSTLIEKKGVRPAIVLGLLPMQMLEQVALKLNIDISVIPSKGRLLRGMTRLVGQSYRNDSKLWNMVAVMAEQIAELDTPTPMEYQHYSTFCPTCEKESPDGADHCIHCGLLLPLNVCPNCQTRNVKAAKFCMGCGQVR